MSQGVMNQLGDIFNKSRSSIDGTKTTLVDDSKSFPADLLNGAMLKMKIGGIDYYRIITDTTTNTLTFATLPGTAASSVWTVTTGVTITVTCATENAAHNDYTITAALAVGNNKPLAVALVGNVLTVTLATGAAGLSDDAKNTVTLVTAAIDALADFSAVAAGSGATVVAPTETAPTFTGGVTEVLPVKGTPYVIGAGSGLAISGNYTTATHAKITAAITSTAAAAANADRKYLLLVNDSDATIYVKMGAAAVANEGIRINANGGSYEMSSTIGNLYTGAVNCISAGGKTLLVTEGV